MVKEFLKRRCLSFDDRIGLLLHKIEVWLLSYIDDIESLICSTQRQQLAPSDETNFHLKHSKLVDERLHRKTAHILKLVLFILKINFSTSQQGNTVHSIISAVLPAKQTFSISCISLMM